MELFAVLIAPDFFGLVPAFEIDGAGIPVVFLARYVIAALQKQDALAARCQFMGQGAAAGAGAYNDHIEMALHGSVSTPFRQRAALD
jgi:hypothetical protein